MDGLRSGVIGDGEVGRVFSAALQCDAPWGSYFFSRVAQHGRRRAEEMREAARTVRVAGFEPFMAAAIADKHDWMAAQAGAGQLRGLGAAPPRQAFVDGLLNHRGPAANDDTVP